MVLPEAARCRRCRTGCHRGLGANDDLPSAAPAGLIQPMPPSPPSLGRQQNAERPPVVSAAKRQPRSTRGRAMKSVATSRSRFLAIGAFALCAFLAAFLLDLRAVPNVMFAVLAGEAGPLARVAAWACMLAVATIAFMALRRAVAARQPARRGRKRQAAPPIADNWALIVLGATAVATTGIAAWTVLLWVANILADGLVLATLAVGVMSIGSIVWALQQPTQSESGKKAGKKRTSRRPGPRQRPRGKADEGDVRLLPPPGVTEQALLQSSARAAVPAQAIAPSPSVLLTPPISKPPEAGQQGS